MSLGVHGVRFSFADYVAFERTSNVKHEYLLGQIYAMAGGTPNHAALTAAISGLLFGQLRGGRCRVYSSDLRVRAGELVTYPDVTIVCGPPEPAPEDVNTILNPSVVVEVTSPSTEDYDRGKKLASYQAIESLDTILLVSHDKPQVERFQRNSNGWTTSVFAKGDTLHLSELGASLAVDTIYEVLPD